MLVPSVRNAGRITHHLAQNGDFIVQSLSLAILNFAGAERESFYELVALFGNDLDRVGRKKLIVAERGSDRARFLVVLESSLHIVAAVAASFEAVDAHNLIPGKPGRERRPGISVLEFAFAARQARNEFKFALRRRKKIGYHRYIRRRILLRLERIARPGRTGINRGLGEHVIVEQ